MMGPDLYLLNRNLSRLSERRIIAFKFTTKADYPAAPRVRAPWKYIGAWGQAQQDGRASGGSARRAPGPRLPRPGHPPTPRQPGRGGSRPGPGFHITSITF